MLQSFANSIAKKIKNNGTITESEQSVIAYGIFLTIIKAVHFCTAMLLGALFGKAISMLVFHLFYITLRTYAGGHHAKSDKICFINSCIISLVVLTFWKSLPLSVYSLATALMLFISIPVVFMLAPVQDKNKPIDALEKKVYRKKSIILTLIESALIVVLYISNLKELALVGATALFVLSILLVAGKLKNLAEEKHKP